MWKGDGDKLPTGWIHICTELLANKEECKTGFHHIQKIDNLTYLARKYEEKNRQKS